MNVTEYKHVIKEATRKGIVQIENKQMFIESLWDKGEQRLKRYTNIDMPRRHLIDTVAKIINYTNGLYKESFITRWTCEDKGYVNPNMKDFGKNYRMTATVKIAGKIYTAGLDFVYNNQIEFNENLYDFRGYISDIQQALGEIVVRGHNETYEVYIGRFDVAGTKEPTTSISRLHG